MPRNDKQVRLWVEGQLRAAGLKVTPQRYAVLDYLWSNRTHPTAEEIEAAVNQRFPCASRATVYNTLHALHEAGLVQELYGQGGVTRYDIKVEPHHHFICRRCGLIEDVKVERLSVKARLPLQSGHRVEELDVVIRGLCAKCRKIAEG
ncbi:Fur family transcriptional regulator [Pyrinomonas methylaliphatogenes]|uniref:Fe2+/Zn2+ uptake regulation protein n=1 Tax=Pyrinomonas methylaliphatogenes TaxID=454194 RepID=A0A0B6WXF5_9BACT|nr:Fur family transcriptional regulator [Pyrinomonas methylaliphatogenes]CDM65958.1 Fe2+/Zn2+ uptake regulation protein [Pyrinomonas methylaliphatogenes]